MEKKESSLPPEADRLSVISKIREEMKSPTGAEDLDLLLNDLNRMYWERKLATDLTGGPKKVKKYGSLIQPATNADQRSAKTRL
jgi:hypothetical protein